MGQNVKELMLKKHQLRKVGYKRQSLRIKRILLIFLNSLQKTLIKNGKKVN